MDISNDGFFLALGDSDRNITIFPHNELENEIKNTLKSEHKKFSIFPIGTNIKKLTLDTHVSSVNSLVFAKIYKYFLISGGSDKSLIIWRIKEDLLYQTVRIIKLQADITDIVLLSNDEYIFSGCLDNNIYVIRSNFNTLQFEQFACISMHNSIITSIAIDPNIAGNNGNNGPIRFATYVNSFLNQYDDGRLILAETWLERAGVRTDVIRDYGDFGNKKNKNSSIQKKIE